MNVPTRNLLFVIILGTIVVGCSEEETAQIECIENATAQTSKTRAVTKYFDAELSENFSPDLFVKNVEERKTEWRVVRDAYLSSAPGDGYWRSNLIIETTKSRQAAERYISEKYYTRGFLEQNLPEVYNVFQQGGRASSQSDKISLADIWNSYVFLKEEEWNGAWLKAELPDLAEYELNDAQLEKVPHDKFYQQELMAFYAMKSHMSLLVQNGSDQLISENDAAPKSLKKNCIE